MASKKRKKQIIKNGIKCLGIAGISVLSLLGVKTIITEIGPINIESLNEDIKIFKNNDEVNNINQINGKVQRENEIIYKKEDIVNELLEDYPIASSFTDNKNKKLLDVIFDETYDNKFIDYGYVNTISVNGNSKIAISHNFKKCEIPSKPVTYAEPGVYYVTCIDNNTGKHHTSKYNIPAVQEIIKEMNLGDHVESVQDVEDIINANLDIFNLNIKFLMSEQLCNEINGETQRLHSIVENIVRERPELSCKNYTIQVTRESDGSVSIDRPVSLTLYQDQIVSDMNYEAQCMFLQKSVDAWIAQYNDKSMYKKDYIKDCISYCLKNFTYKRDAIGTSSAHPVTNLISTKYGVCDSFSNFLNIMLNPVGIESEMLTGIYTPTGENHGWNTIKYNNTDYMIDISACLSSNETPTMARAGLTLNDLTSLGYVTETPITDKMYTDNNLLKVICNIDNSDNPMIEPETGSIYIIFNKSVESDKYSSDEYTAKIKEILNTKSLEYYEFELSSGYTVRRYVK